MAVEDKSTNTDQVDENGAADDSTLTDSQPSLQSSRKRDDEVPIHQTRTFKVVVGAMAGGALVAGAAVAVAPVAVAAIGFGSGGVAAGSIAAGIQSVIGNVVAGSWFASLMSAGAAGFSASTTAAIAATGAVAGAAAGAGTAVASTRGSGPRNGSGTENGNGAENGKVFMDAATHTDKGRK